MLPLSYALFYLFIFVHFVLISHFMMLWFRVMLELQTLCTDLRVQSGMAKRDWLDKIITGPT